MASRRLETILGEAIFDLGTPAFAVRDPGFAAQVRQWAELDIVAPWAAAGSDHWVGVPAMNAPLKAMAQGLDVHWGTRVSSLSPTFEGWRITTDRDVSFEAEAVAIALPAEQTGDLLAPVATDFSRTALLSRSTSCWTALLAFPERVPVLDDYLVGSGDSPLGVAIRNSAKPGRSGLETWVVHAGADWSSRHLEAASGWIEGAVTEAFSDRVAAMMPVPIGRAAHRWRYARPTSAGRGAAWDPRARLGICGDWVAGSGVEEAWCSGTDLAALMIANWTLLSER